MLARFFLTCIIFIFDWTFELISSLDSMIPSFRNRDDYMIGWLAEGFFEESAANKMPKSIAAYPCRHEIYATAYSKS